MEDSLWHWMKYYIWIVPNGTFSTTTTINTLSSIKTPRRRIKHAKQNHRETKTDIENLNRLHNEQQGKLTTTM